MNCVLCKYLDIKNSNQIYVHHCCSESPSDQINPLCDSTICLDISDDSYFYILHIVDEIIVASFDTAVASGCGLMTGNVVVVAVAAAAVIVTMRLDTDVTS